MRYDIKPDAKSLGVPVYGLHILPLQPVLVPPPSAFTTVGVTKVVRNSTAAPRVSSTRFTVISF
jgi:hypothetical protein